MDFVSVLLLLILVVNCSIAIVVFRIGLRLRSLSNLESRDSRSQDTLMGIKDHVKRIENIVSFLAYVIKDSTKKN